MKAIRIHRRGGPEQLVYEEAPKPVATPGDALVRVRAMSITSGELNWDATYTTREGRDRVPSIPGHDLSGVVESVSDGTTGVGAGDEVYALTDFWRDGSAADYVAVRAADLAPKPKTIDHEHAAAVPLSSLTAWQALFDRAGLVRGQRVLIHGAAGGVGTYAVQLARWKGAHVVATASSRNAAFLRELGAAEIIDYTTSRFEDKVKDVDVVLDTLGGATLERSWGVLRPGGTLVTLPAPPPEGKVARYEVRGIFFIVEPNRSQLIEIGRLIDGGLLRPGLAEVFPVSKAKEAFLQGSKGHNRGKVVLRVSA